MSYVFLCQLQSTFILDIYANYRGSNSCELSGIISDFLPLIQKGKIATEKQNYRPPKKIPKTGDKNICAFLYSSSSS